jgi:hypothetical protein
MASPLFTGRITLLAQAAVEYGLLSGGRAPSASGGFAAIAGCRVDSSLLTCLNHSYPETTILVAAVICLILVTRLSRRSRHRAR